MKTYGYKETMNGAILQVLTDYDLVIAVSVGNINAYNITFLNVQDVEDLIKQLQTWLYRQPDTG